MDKPVTQEGQLPVAQEHHWPLSLEDHQIAHRDWRIWAGSGLSILWIGSGLFYLFAVVGWDRFWAQGIDQLGSFLEGAFAPLAFLWLVIGLFIQQKELAKNNVELRKTNEQSKRQTEAIAATALNARQETFFMIAGGVRQQLGGITGMLLLSSKGTVGDGTFSREEFSDFWQRHATGDDEFFARQFLTIALAGDDTFEDLFYGTKIRIRHTENYKRNFRRLLKLAADCDVDDIITDAMKDTAHGMLYLRMIEYAPGHAEP